MKKVIIIALLIVLLGGFGVTAYASDWYSLPASEWGERLGIKDQEEDTDKNNSGMTGGVVDGNGNIMSVTGVNVMPEAMAFSSDRISDEENSSVTITATIIPENATNKELNWGIRWKDPDSEWATGKTVTDYVMVTQDLTKSNQATVSCLQPFGEQALVICSSKANVTISKSCTVDYNARLIGKADITYSGNGISYTLKSGQKTIIKPTEYNEVGWSSGIASGDLDELAYTDGTIKNDQYVVRSVTLDISENFREFLDGLNVLNGELASGSIYVTDETFEQTGLTAFSINSLLSICASAQTVENRMKYILAYETDGEPDITLTFEISNGSTSKMEMVLDFTDVYTKVTGVELDQGQIVF